jgi:hypothetical protein
MSRATILVLRCSRLVGESVLKSTGFMEVAQTWRILTHDLADPYRPDFITCAVRSEMAQKAL